MRRRGRTLALAALHAAAIAAVGVWAGVRLEARLAERALPPLQPRPWTVAPLYDDPAVVSDRDLGRLLARLGLRDRGMETEIGNVDHLLRLWGPEIVFADPELLSGPQLLELLTDHRRFGRVYGSDRPPLLLDQPRGVRVRALEGATSVSHHDHLTATLAELGLPLAQPIVTPEGPATFRAIVEQSLRDFSLNQAEYEWSTLTYVLFLPPVRRWTTSEGQEVDFDRLAERVMRERLPEGVCSAHHRLHALTALLRVDAEAPVLSAAERERVSGYLKAATELLVRHQHADGFWSFDWPFAPPADARPSAREGDRLADRLIATGHPLEWWSLAPEELQPPRRTVVAAARWLLATVDAMGDDEIQENISFLSHAGRALAQWRGREPAAALAALGPVAGAADRGAVDGGTARSAGPRR